MICLSLTGKTLDENLDCIREYRPYISLVELRVDRLNRKEIGRIAAFPRAAGLPVILTIRRQSDGGGWGGPEDERRHLLQNALRGSFDYVCLEDDLPPLPEEEGFLNRCGRIIRAFYDCGGVPGDLAERVRRLPRRAGEVPLAAVTPGNTRELISLFEAAASLTEQEVILHGMGDVGVPARILASKLGSLLTFATPSGLLDPKTLESLYGYSKITDKSLFFGIIGSPVMHTKSPVIHNTGYKQWGLDAVYIPFEIDDPELFLPWAEGFGFRGFSVTVPHKSSIIPLLSWADPAVEAVGSCNTLVRSSAGWEGYNTDVEGFLTPLDAFWPAEDYKKLTAAVIGAGGAARAVVYGLRSRGVSVTIYNRTESKARLLAEQFGASWRGLNRGRTVAPADILVQTSVLGMAPHYPGDPVPEYKFSGTELAYDLIYAPEETLFLKRARKAGCTVLGGMMMLKAQGARQFRYFTGKEITGPEN